MKEEHWNYELTMDSVLKKYKSQVVKHTEAKTKMHNAAKEKERC